MGRPRALVARADSIPSMRLMLHTLVSLSHAGLVHIPQHRPQAPTRPRVGQRILPGHRGQLAYLSVQHSLL